MALDYKYISITLILIVISCQGYSQFSLECGIPSTVSLTKSDFSLLERTGLYVAMDYDLESIMYGTLYIYQSTPAIQSNVHEIGLYARYHYGIKANKRIGVDPYLAVFLRFKPDKSNIFYPYLALSPWIKIVEKLEIRSILGLGYGYSYKDKNFTFVIPFRFSVGFNYSI